MKKIILPAIIAVAAYMLPLFTTVVILFWMIANAIYLGDKFHFKAYVRLLGSQLGYTAATVMHVNDVAVTETENAMARGQLNFLQSGDEYEAGYKATYTEQRKKLKAEYAPRKAKLEAETAELKAKINEINAKSKALLDSVEA